MSQSIDEQLRTAVLRAGLAHKCRVQAGSVVGQGLSALERQRLADEIGHLPPSSPASLARPITDLRVVDSPRVEVRPDEPEPAAASVLDRWWLELAVAVAVALAVVVARIAVGF